MDDPAGGHAGGPVRLNDITPAGAGRRGGAAPPRPGRCSARSLRRGDRFLNALAAWRKAAGPAAGRRCSVVALEGQTLVIRTPDPRWAEELGRLERRLVAALAVEGLDVKSLRCLIAPGDPPPARARAAPERARTAEGRAPARGADLLQLFDAIAEHYQRIRGLTARRASAREIDGGPDRQPDH
jgi:hypothetical protein